VKKEKTKVNLLKVKSLKRRIPSLDCIRMWSNAKRKLPRKKWNNLINSRKNALFSQQGLPKIKTRFSSKVPQ
jgi:hypothetical protein